MINKSNKNPTLFIYTFPLLPYPNIPYSLFYFPSSFLSLFYPFLRIQR